MILHTVGILVWQVLKFNKETGESSWVTEAVRPRASPRPKATVNVVTSAEARRRADERARVEEAARSLPRLEEVWPGMEVNGVVTGYVCPIELLFDASRPLFPTLMPY